MIADNPKAFDAEGKQSASSCKSIFSVGFKCLVVREKKACHMDNLMDEVMAFAKTLNKNRDTIQAMKAETHKEIVSIIDDTVTSFSR